MHSRLLFSVDLLAHVFDVLKADLKSDHAKELFLYYQGTTVVLQFLKPVNKVKHINIYFYDPDLAKAYSNLAVYWSVSPSAKVIHSCCTFSRDFYAPSSNDQGSGKSPPM